MRSTHVFGPYKHNILIKPAESQGRYSQFCSYESVPCPDFRRATNKVSRTRRNPWYQLVLVHIKHWLCCLASGSRLQLQCLWLHLTVIYCLKSLPTVDCCLLQKYLHLFEPEGSFCIGAHAPLTKAFNGMHEWFRTLYYFVPELNNLDVGFHEMTWLRFLYTTFYLT